MTTCPAVAGAIVSASRDRKRRGGSGESFGGQNESVEAIQDDDVLVPVAGILEVLDSYAFLRTSGYLPGEKRRLRSTGHRQKERPAQG